ncbi:hypothetical protein [Pinibacter aurantiacus]|uniref:Uncharacterized protein n=1 Tax=Pinibacter aurantiacus TaxID=2851599 RepID=A0A9E2S5Z2_9BACT|nr:hypothetical protein [Pinibacter aurantiacus]MBV4355828.1 hypothetical protein [Pinibacter aurantiacus]
MKQIFAFILSLSLVVVVASTNCEAATTLRCDTIIAKNTVCKNIAHKVFAHTNTNAHQQPVGKTKVSKSSLGGFSKENFSISSFINTTTNETTFISYQNVQPAQRLYVLHCSYLL